YVLFPALARITTDRDRLRAACRRSIRAMSMIGFPTALILVPLGVPAAVIAFGEVWKSAGYAAMALAGIAATGTMISFASEVLKADGRPDRLTAVRGVSLIASIVFMIALLPFDLIGVCAGLTIGATIGAGYALVIVGRQLEIDPWALAREVLPSATAAIVMAAVLTPVEFLLVQASSHGTILGLLLLALEALLGAGIYLLALRLASRSQSAELMTLVRRLILRRGEADPTAVSADGVFEAAAREDAAS
ncbi:MAG TPA: polysaccharide biosynthesis C-terminal domain-containing protein, partial [Solirubrobacterales bacterium]